MNKQGKNEPFTGFRDGKRGDLVVDRDALHASPGYKRQVAALAELQAAQPQIPNKTLDNPPQQFQRVLYWFEPFQKWYLGHYVDGSFCSYSGFCDHYDAPYWLPLPPNPKQ